MYGFRRDFGERHIYLAPMQEAGQVGYASGGGGGAAAGNYSLNIGLYPASRCGREYK